MDRFGANSVLVSTRDFAHKQQLLVVRIKLSQADSRLHPGNELVADMRGSHRDGGRGGKREARVSQLTASTF